MTFLQKSNDIQRRLEDGDIDINEAAGELLIAHGWLINEIERLLDEDDHPYVLHDYLWTEIKTE